MLYMPATTLSAPIATQETSQVLLPSTACYYMVQPTGGIPAVSFINSPLIYPRYGFIPQPVQNETTNKIQLYADPSRSSLDTPPVQHVVHHYCQHSAPNTCPCYKENTYSSAPEPRPPTPPIYDHQPQPQRYSRRDQYERDRSHSPSNDKHEENIDEKIERVRRELRRNFSQKRDQSTETVDYYKPPPRPPTPPVTYKQHYDAPKSPQRSRSRSRSRSASLPRRSSLPRSPWRSTNQNDYPWRDAHLPAYREATIARSQTPVNQTRTWKESGVETNYATICHSNSGCTEDNYLYRPASATVTRQYYTQSTGKNADHEVHQALCGSSKIIDSCYCSPAPRCDNYQSSTYGHSFYSDVPTGCCTPNSMINLDATRYTSNDSCLHIVPKQGSTCDAPYFKVLNAPVTYLH